VKVARVTTVAELLSAVDALLSVDAGDSDDSGGAFAALHDAALHDAALLALAGLACFDPMLSEAGAWGRAFELWRRVFESEEFWSLLVAADLKGDYEQPVTFGEVNELRLRAPRLVSAPVAERARDAALRQDLRVCARALTILRGAGLPAPLVEEYERETVGPAEDGLIEKLDAAFAWVGVISVGDGSPATRRNYCNQAWRRFEDVRPRLAEFAGLAGADSYFARRVFEHAASKLFHLAEAFDEAGRREESLFVCLKAHALAPHGCEPLDAIKEKLRATGGVEVLRERAASVYAEALARELADERAPSKLFKDDPAGGKTLDSFTGRQDSSSGCLTSVVLWLAMVGVGVMLQLCSVIKPGASYPPFNPLPRMTFTPEPLNLNLNLNYNVMPLNLRPYLVEPPGASKPRGRRRANRRAPPRGSNDSEPLPFNLGGPSNPNTPRE
jgi:hypothetical protein